MLVLYTAHHIDAIEESRYTINRNLTTSVAWFYTPITASAQIEMNKHGSLKSGEVYSCSGIPQGSHKVVQQKRKYREGEIS